MEEKNYSRRALWLSILALVLLLGTMAGATLAWFTVANQAVDTSTVSARTGSGLKLELSSREDFANAGEEAAIVQINGTNAMELLPVSTDDLLNFSYCFATNNGMASGFRRVEDEGRYFHGRVYLRASAEDIDRNTDIDIFLDGRDEENPMFSNVDGMLLNAARLGLQVRENAPVILQTSKTGNGAGATMNTQVNGVVQQEGIVLHCDAEEKTISAVKDPSLLWEDCMMTQTTWPERALFTVKVNTIYALDIYFYLEGCDPDCTNIISAKQADIQLRLFAVIA